jgi:O-Antigen ligase
MSGNLGPKLSVAAGGAAPGAKTSAPTLVVLAALLYGLALVAGLRDGGFWPRDALVVAVTSLVLLAVATIAGPRDRAGLLVTGGLLLLALWWLLRAVTAASPAAFLPFGASILAFAAAFAVVRPLRDRARERAAVAVGCLGAATSAVGLAGLVWRWFPMAMPSQGLWRLSTALTYADAAGLALAVCLLVALGTDAHLWLARVSVCLCAAGLLATQSRGALLAFACACAIVPWRRYVRFLVPLLGGAALGVAAVASSPQRGAVPWLGVLAVAAVLTAGWFGGEVRFGRPGGSGGLVVGALVLGGIAVAAVLLHHEVGLRALAPSDQDRTVEWSTAFHQWASAPVIGVGPDRPLLFHAADGSLAHFVHNEYLQIAADTGVAGLALFGLAAVAVLRLIRRIDVLSCCAAAACVCWAVAGGVDFDWHLPVVGLLGGCCAGLAARRGDEPWRAG